MQVVLQIAFGFLHENFQTSGNGSHWIAKLVQNRRQRGIQGSDLKEAVSFDLNLSKLCDVLEHTCVGSLGLRRERAPICGIAASQSRDRSADCDDFTVGKSDVEFDAFSFCTRDEILHTDQDVGDIGAD